MLGILLGLWDRSEVVGAGRATESLIRIQDVMDSEATRGEAAYGVRDLVGGRRRFRDGEGGATEERGRRCRDEELGGPASELSYKVEGAAVVEAGLRRDASGSPDRHASGL